MQDLVATGDRLVYEGAFFDRGSDPVEINKANPLTGELASGENFKIKFFYDKDRLRLNDCLEIDTEVAECLIVVSDNIQSGTVYGIARQNPLDPADRLLGRRIAFEKAVSQFADPANRKILWNSFLTTCKQPIGSKYKQSGVVYKKFLDRARNES